MAEKVEIIIGAKDKFSGAFGKLRSSLPSIKTLAVGAGAAVAGMGTAMFAMAKTTATAYDKVQKFSDRIGISTEALSKYHHVADLSGVSIEAMNMGFQRMTRRISEAEAGMGVAGKALDELGISIGDIAGQAPDKQFEIIAGALEGVSFQGDKARLAMQFFDSEGVALLQTLKGGTKGLEEMKAEAEKFGLVVSAKAGANAAAFNDSLTRLTGSFKGLKNYMAEQVMPTITGLANRMADWIANNRQQIIEYAKSFVGAMAKVVEYGAYAIAGLIDAWRGLQMIYEVLKIGFSSFAGAMVEGLSFITEKLLAFMEATNISGMFDGAIENVQGFLQANKDAAYALEQTGQAAYANLNKIANEGLAINKVTEFKEAAQEMMAELTAEGEAKPTGIHPFTETNTKKTLSNIKQNKEAIQAAYESLNEMWMEQNYTEEERLTFWYEKQQELFTGNEEALTKLTDVYLKKRAKLKADDSRKELDARKKLDATKKLLDQKRYQATMSILGQTAELAKNFGKKGFKIWRALAAAEATIGAFLGFGRTMGEYAYPYNIILAAVSLAAGLANVARITSTSYPSAHGGLDYVPKETTFLLDKGERIISPKQNKDLTGFINENRSGASGVIVNDPVFNIYAIDPLEDIDWENTVENDIMPAFSKLAAFDIKPTGY